MTDHNFTNLPTLDLLGMLYSAQANYANAIAARLVNDLEGYDRDAVETFADSLIGGWEFDYSAHVGAALDRLAAAKLLTR